MSRKSDLIRYGGFYDGDIDTIYAHFKERRISQDAKDNENEMPEYRFVYRNFIRFLVDKLVNYLPTEFTLEAKLPGMDAPDNKMGEEITAWLEGQNFGDNKSFWELLPGTYRSGYKYGTSYLVFYVKDGVARIRKGYSENATIVVNPQDVNDIQKIVFEWDVDIEDGEGSTNTVTIKEIITDTEYQLWQDNTITKIEPHNFGRFPVIILRHGDVEGSQYGESVIKGLLEVQQNINLASTLRQYANKANSYGIWCVDDPNAEIRGNITIAPGTLSKVPIKSVGGNITLQSLENEIEDYTEEIHDLANVPRKRSVMSALGGQATATEINVLLKDMNEAGKLYIRQCQKTFEEMCELYWLIQHGQEIDVTINYPSMDQKDKDWLQWEAGFLNGMGFFDESLKVIGYDDQKIDGMKEAKAISDAQEQAVFESTYQKSMAKDEKIESKDEEQ